MVGQMDELTERSTMDGSGGLAQRPNHLSYRHGDCVSRMTRTGTIKATLALSVGLHGSGDERGVPVASGAGDQVHKL